MPELTRRRYPEREDCWHVYYGDVHVGTIAVRARWARLGLDRACSEGARPRRRAIRGYEAGAVPGHGPARFGYT
jgi:hypothetical protein